MSLSELIVVAVFIIVVGALVAVRRHIETGGQTVALRQLVAFRALRRQLGMALESGRPPLFALGRGELHTTAGPVSVAGLQILQELVETSGRGQLTPQVMIGAATLLPIAQDSLRRETEEDLVPQGGVSNFQFVADEAFPFTFAAGTGASIERKEAIASIAVGRFGQEIAIIGEAAQRSGMEQVMGSDDPAAIAISVASTENTLWGEEVFASGAYLRQTSWDLAAVRVQDILRWLLIAALLLGAIVNFAGSF